MSAEELDGEIAANRKIEKKHITNLAISCSLSMDLFHQE